MCLMKKYIVQCRIAREEGLCEKVYMWPQVVFSCLALSFFTCLYDWPRAVFDNCLC